MGQSPRIKVLPHSGISTVSPQSVSSRSSSALVLRGSGFNHIDGLRCTFGMHSSVATVVNQSVVTCESPVLPTSAMSDPTGEACQADGLCSVQVQVGLAIRGFNVADPADGPVLLF